MVTEELQLVVRANTTDAIAGLNAVEAKAGAMSANLSRTMTSAGRALTTGLTLPIIGAATGIGRMAMGFETGMAQIQALAGATAEEVAELSVAALAMGSEFGVGAEDAAKGLFFLKSAGLANAEAIEVLRLSAMGAAIGLGDMGEIANGLTTVMLNFGLTGEESLDKVAASARKAKADPAELMHILNGNAAAAASVGMSFDDLAGISSFLTVAFGDVRTAGTGMRGMITKMVKPTEMAQKALADIGITADEFTAMMADDMVGALHLLDAEFTAVGNNQWMGQVFEDTEAIKAVSAILLQSEEDVAAYADSIANSAGVADDAWSTMAATSGVKVAQAMEGLKSALIPIGNTIVDIVVPAIESLSGWLTNMAQKWTELSPKTQDFIIKAVGIAAALGPVLLIMGKLIGFVGRLNPYVLILTGIIAGGIWLMDKFGVSIGDVVDFLRPFVTVVQDLGRYLFDTLITGDSMNDWLTHLPEPLQVVAQAVGDVIGAFSNFVTGIFGVIQGGGDMQDVIDKLPGPFKVLATVIGEAVEFVREHFDKFMEILGLAWEHVLTLFNTVWAALQPVFEAFASLVETVFSKVSAFLTEHWDSIVATFEEFMATVEEIWTDIWAFLGPLITEIVEFAEKLFGRLIEWFQENWPLIQETITTILHAIKAIWDLVWPAIQKTIEVVWGIIQPIVENAMNAILGVIKFIMGLITLDWEAAWGGIKDFFGGIWGGFRAVVGGIMTGILEAFNTVFGFFKTAWHLAWGGIRNFFVGLWEGIKGVIGGIIDWIADKIQWALDRIEDLRGVVNFLIPGGGVSDKLNQAAQAAARGSVIVNKTPTLKGDGGTINSPGLYTLGERGRSETVHISGTGTVSQGGGALIGEVTIIGAHDATEVARELGWELLRRGG